MAGKAQKSEEKAQEQAEEGSGSSDELQNKLEEKTREAEDYLNRLKYLQADFENLKKQVEKERAEFIKFATEPLILELIDVMENLERAVNSSEGEQKKGIELIYNQLKNILDNEGLEPIPAVGEKCDPYKHEVLMCETKEDCEDDTIIEELQRGYTLRGKVIRCAKVKVAKRGD